MINPYAVGKLCYLRVPEEFDENSNWHQWFSDPTVTKYLPRRYWPNTKTDLRRFIRKLVGEKSLLVLLVCSLDSDIPIGVVSLDEINLVHRYAGFSMVFPPIVNGEPRISFEASTLILDIAFYRLNLLNVKTFTVSSNAASINMQKLLGFKDVGTFSNIFNIGGEQHNETCMQLNVSDWRNRA